jgi:hypothetical protein
MQLPSYSWRLVHLTALWGYGVSQPVFSLLGRNPEFLVFNGASRADMVTFALLVVFAPPLVVLGMELVAETFSRHAGAVVHLLGIWAFGFCAALQVLARFDPTSTWTMLLPAVVAYAGAIAYARWSAVRLFLTLSLALPIAGLVSFVATTRLAVDDAEAASVTVRTPTPVVLVVLDELPLSSLMTPSGALDAQRFPGFGALAHQATWYSRAVTVADHTPFAVPAILSGDRPGSDDLPTLADYPDNLFTLLGGAYTVRAQEPVTRLCPVRYCPQHRPDPSIIHRLRRLFHDVTVDYLAGALPANARSDLVVAEGWEVGLVTNTAIDGMQFARRIGLPNPPSTLYFLHVLQPHQPWALLPSGRHYNDPWVVPGVTDDWRQGEEKRLRPNDLLVEQALQRHLLQLRAVDRLVGTIFRQLRRQGLLDRALVVVTADHGASFRAGGWIRRTTPDNLPDIAAVPLFVKYPHQARGHEDRRSAETTDVLPTIADVLGIALPWHVDGRSLRSAPVNREVRVETPRGSTIAGSSDLVESGVREVAQRHATWLGSGTDSLYHVGPRLDLHGRAVSGFPTVAASGARVSIPRLSDLEHVDKSSGYVPAHFLGQVSWRSLRRSEEIAIAVNGRLAATTRPFTMRGGIWVDAMLDEHLLHDGRNTVGIYAVRGRGATTRLVHLGGNTSIGAPIAVSATD